MKISSVIGELAVRTIWKFVLNPNDLKLRIPAGAKILTAREQGDAVCIWAEVNPTAEPEERMFEVFGTGHDMPFEPSVERTYIGTAMLNGGALVFHVYEKTQR